MENHQQVHLFQYSSLIRNFSPKKLFWFNVKHHEIFSRAEFIFKMTDVLEGHMAI